MISKPQTSFICIRKLDITNGIYIIYVNMCKKWNGICKFYFFQLWIRGKYLMKDGQYLKLIFNIKLKLIWEYRLSVSAANAIFWRFFSPLRKKNRFFFFSMSLTMREEKWLELKMKEGVWIFHANYPFFLGSPQSFYKVRSTMAVTTRRHHHL